MDLPKKSVLLYLTSLIPDSESSAVRVKITEVESVYLSPSLISMEPVGGVSSLSSSSSSPFTSKKSALKKEASRNIIKRINAKKESIRLSIPQPLFEKQLKFPYMDYETIFYNTKIMKAGFLKTFTKT